MNSSIVFYRRLINMKTKKFITILLLATMLAILMAFSASAAEANFTDVKSSDWFYNDVKTAVEMGLVNGKTATTYAPNDNLTYAEAVKLAACMHQRYTTGGVSLSNSSTGKWYTTYVDYAKANGIVSSEFDWDASATRAGYMTIFAKALPDSALQAVNDIPDNTIPDVKSSDYYGPAVYKLYRAGIVQGVDANYNCNPGSNIKRSEVAAILTRMMDRNARKYFSTAPSEPLTIVSQPKSRTISDWGDVTFSVKVSGGNPPYTYRWFKAFAGQSDFDAFTPDFYTYEGMYTDTFTSRSNLKEYDNGSKYFCVIYDSNGDFVISDKAYLYFR